MHFKSFKNKLFAFFIAIQILQTSVTGGLYYYLSTHSLKDKLINSYGSIAESTGRSLDLRLERIEWYMTQLLTSSSLQNLLKEIDFNSTGGEFYQFMATANRIIDNILYNDKYISAALVAPISVKRVYTLRNIAFIDIEDSKDKYGLLQFEKTIELNGKINWMGFITQGGERYFGVSRLLRDVTTQYATQDPLAVIYLFFSEEMIRGILNVNMTDKDSSIIIMDEFMNILSDAGKRLDISGSKSTLADRLGENQGVFQTDLGGTNVLVSYYSLQNRPWKVVFVVPYSNIFLQTRYIVLSAGLLSIFMFIGFSVVSYIFTRNVSRPLKWLNEGFKELESGNFDVVVKKSSEDELGKIIDRFNRMASRVSDLFQKVVTEEKMKREYEIRLLQYQINPHFLYNTLNSVRLMALMSKNSEIANILDALIKFLRSVVGKKDSLIPLEEELENVKLYIRIMNLRYSDMIKTDFSIEEDVYSCKVPNFFLQPIIENAIFHGIEPKKFGTINITVSGNGGILFLSVRDNGVGMTKQQINTLLDSIANESDVNHIGLNNVDKRIKLYFGEKYGLSIESEPGQGTMVLVKIPVIR